MRKLILALAIFASPITGAFGKTGIIVLPPDSSEPKEVLTRIVGEAILALGPDDRLLVVSARRSATIWQPAPIASSPAMHRGSRHIRRSATPSPK